MCKRVYVVVLIGSFLFGCGAEEVSSIGSSDVNDKESCALKPFKDGGWLLGIVPGMHGDSISPKVFRLPSFFQSFNGQIDTLRTDCEDILYTHLQVKIDRDRLQYFSTVIICYDKAKFEKISDYLRTKMNGITGKKVEVSPYMVWTLLKDHSRWIVELRDMRSVMDTLAYEYVVKNAGSY